MPDQAENIFGNTNTDTNPNPPAGGSNPPAAPNSGNDYADLLSTIKNERGEQKYGTLAEALVGTKHAQEYIATLKAEKAQRDAEIETLRVQAARAAALEESLTALSSQRNVDAPQGNQPFDENKLAELVNQTLTQREQKAIQTANVASVVSTLQQSFGADAEAKFYDKAKEMGMPVAEMNALAAKSPKAVLSMLGVTQAAPKQNQSNPTASTVNSSAFTPQPNTFVGRNPKPALIGATTQDIKDSMNHAKSMVDELHAKGLSVSDLSDPKVYNKFFK